MQIKRLASKSAQGVRYLRNFPHIAPRLSITRRVARRGREAIQSAEAWREAEADGRLVELVGLYINREEDVV